MTATTNRDSARTTPLGSVPDLRYSDHEEELRSAVRGLFADRSPWPALLARIETSEPGDPALWHALAAELGCAGLLIPEEHGGAGASYREAAVVAEETGYAVAPGEDEPDPAARSGDQPRIEGNTSPALQDRPGGQR